MDQKKIHEKGKIIMNKHFKTFLLVIGGALLVSGSALFAAGCKNVAIKAKTREFDLTGQTIEKFRPNEQTDTHMPENDPESQKPQEAFSLLE